MNLDKMTKEELIEEVKKLKSYLRDEYKFRWFVRKTMLPIHGVKCTMTDDLKGVTMPDGTFISYGIDYENAYFLGRII